MRAMRRSGGAIGCDFWKAGTLYDRMTLFSSVSLVLLLLLVTGFSGFSVSTEQFLDSTRQQGDK